MPELDDDVSGYDDILGRISGGASGIVPRSDSGGIVLGALKRRRRRRRVVAAGTAAAVVVAAVGAGSVLVTRLGGSDGPAPATTTGEPSAFGDGRYVPAKFFADLAGGTATPKQVVHHLATGERLYAELSWVPAQLPDEKIPVVIALEHTGLSPEQACRTKLVMGGGDTCQARPDGAFATSFELPARGAYYDPLHRKAPFEVAKGFEADSTVRGVSYARADGLVVSVYVCRCASKQDPDPSDPPVTDVVLEQVAADPSWDNSAYLASVSDSPTG